MDQGTHDTPPAIEWASDALRDVAAERRRQIEAEGYDPEHDDCHVNDEIAALACFYAMPQGAREWDASSTGYGLRLGDAILPYGWASIEDGYRRRELVKAGALILAEIERLDRRPQGRCSNDECGWRGDLADAVQKDGAYFCPYNGFDVVKPNTSYTTPPVV